MDKVLLAIVTGTIAIVLILSLMSIKYDRSLEEIWRSLKSKPTGNIFTVDMVANLDEPVQRYFLHAIKPETILASYIELEMRGSFRLQPDGEWLPMRASQIISLSPGFIWKANIGRGLKRFSGADYYAQNKGRVKFSLWGLIPLVDTQNKDINRSSIGRLCIEYFWLPSALLPQNGVVWQAISDNTIRANFEVDREPITLTLNIDSYGKVLNISLPRWGDSTEDKNWQYIPFGGEVEAEAIFNGYTIPAKMNAGYWFGTDNYWAFFQAIIERAKFNHIS